MLLRSASKPRATVPLRTLHRRPLTLLLQLLRVACRSRGKCGRCQSSCRESSCRERCGRCRRRGCGGVPAGRYCGGRRGRCRPRRGQEGCQGWRKWHFLVDGSRTRGGKEVHAEEQAEETKEANGQEEESYEGKTTGLKSDDALQCRMHARSFLALFLISHFYVFPNSII